MLARRGAASAGGYPCPLPFDSMGTVPRSTTPIFRRRLPAYGNSIDGLAKDVSHVILEQTDKKPRRQDADGLIVKLPRTDPARQRLQLIFEVVDVVPAEVGGIDGHLLL